MDGQIWALKADSLTSPLIVTVTVTVTDDAVMIIQALIRLSSKAFRRLYKSCASNITQEHKTKYQLQQMFNLLVPI